MGACHRFAGGFAGAQPRLAKIAQFIAIFRLRAVAPYLPAPRTVDLEIEAPPAPCGEQGNPKQIILGNWGTVREITRVRGTLRKAA